MTAVVAPADPAAPPTIEDIKEHLRTKLAGYKIPKSVVLVAQIERSPAGKADYRWARTIAEGA